MTSRKLPLLLSLLLIAPRSAPAQDTQVVLSDTFGNGNPLFNDGTGGNWVFANQGNATDPGLAHAEENSVLRLASGTGAWNIGGIKSTNSFMIGTTVEV